jgi:hypothetical protein
MSIQCCVECRPYEKSRRPGMVASLLSGIRRHGSGRDDLVVETSAPTVKGAMTDRHLIGPLPSTTSARTPSSVSRRRALPADLLKDASRRLGGPDAIAALSVLVILATVLLHRKDDRDPTNAAARRPIRRHQCYGGSSSADPSSSIVRFVDADFGLLGTTQRNRQVQTSFVGHV